MKINKAELQTALEIVKPGLANKDVIEQATSFAFINDRVVTFNNEISISHPIAGMNLSGAVKAEELYQLLHKLKGDEIEIELTETEIRLTSGRSNAGMVLQAEVKMPLDEITLSEEWYPLPEDFLTALKFAVPSCGKNMSRPILTALHVKEDVVEASDGYCISRYIIKEAMPTPELLIPATSVRQVLKLSPEFVSHSDGWVHFRTVDETIISCRLFVDSYPSLDGFLKEQGTELTLPKSMAEVLERSSVFSKQGDVETGVSVTIENNKFKIRSESEVGWFEEELNFKYDGEVIAFSVLPSFLKNILSQTLSCVLSSRFVVFKGEEWTYLSIFKS